MKRRGDFSVDWIERVIAQLRHVNRSSVVSAFGSFTRLEFEPRYLGCYAVFPNVSASATALSIALLLFTVS